MNNRIIWFGAVLILGLAVAAWFLRSPSAEIAQGTGTALSETAHPGQLPPSSPSAGVQDGSNLAQSGAHPNGNGNGKGNGTGSAAAAKPAHKDPRIAAQERAFIAKLFEPPGRNATDQERLAWEQSPISDLLYPPDHPCAGQPLDSTSPAVLAGAGKDALAKVIDAIPDVDEPQCVYQGNWSFSPLNQACSGVNPKDPDSVARCTNFLQTMDQDPKAYPATIWLPCSGNGAQPTTRRNYFEDLLAQQVDQVFSGPRCVAP